MSIIAVVAGDQLVSLPTAFLLAHTTDAANVGRLVGGLRAQAVTTNSSAYFHKQPAPVFPFMVGVVLVLTALVWIIGGKQERLVVGGMYLLIVITIPVSRHETIEDQGDALAIRFGRFPFFRKTVRYAEIEAIEVKRLPWFLWNQLSPDYVLVYSKNRMNAIFTDDFANLVQFLQGKISERR